MRECAPDSPDQQISNDGDRAAPNWLLGRSSGSKDRGKFGTRLFSVVGAHGSPVAFGRVQEVISVDIIQLEKLLKATPERSEKLQHACEALQEIENDESSVAPEREQYVHTLRTISALFDHLGHQKTAFRLNRMVEVFAQADCGVVDPLVACTEYSRIPPPVWLARASMIAGVDALIHRKKKNRVDAILRQSEWSDMEEPLHVMVGKKSLSESVLEWRKEFNKSKFDCRGAEHRGAKLVLENLRTENKVALANGWPVEKLAASRFRSARDFLVRRGLLPTS